MSTYALQTKTMLQPVSNSPLQLLGLAAKRDEPKSQLPSKRRRDIICGLGTFNKPFTIQPCPDSPYHKPATFKPVRVIGRSQLPLTFLDTSSDESFATNSLFSARIDVLESNEDTKETDFARSKVLIARYETKRTLYAIERVHPLVYSVCKLANWLKEKDVTDLWDPSNLSELTISSKPDMIAAATGEWWQHAVVDTRTTEQPAKQAKMTMMRSNPVANATTAELEMTIHDLGYHKTLEMETSLVDLSQEPSIHMPLPEQQLASLLQQYLDAVYMSKTSLAYFAKGPITRIRNAFTLPDEGAPSTHELVSFLRSMLLSPKSSEKKYYEKIPTIIKAIPPGSFSDEDLGVGTGKPKKSKKKIKLSREGVYPEEEIIIKKWWMSELPNGDAMSVETIDQRIKRRLGDLRVRETLAQMILMLEIVALEALSTYKPPPEAQTLSDETQTQNQDEMQTIPKKRKKKLDDIDLQLDLLLDKLCIWHATEELGILDFDTLPSRPNDSSDANGRHGASDRLHSFCVEVIIPFYMNRLPEQALMVNKKLGGPAHTSPPKRKAMKPPTASRKSGEPKEPEVKKSRRSLARVATHTMGRTIERVTPTLHRSATDSTLVNGVKREGSEVPLSSIPFQRSPSKSARQSMSQMRHLQGREIDLTQPSAAAAAKLKQKQRVEEDLKDAISALKKPNRGLAAGGYVADIERRGLGSTSKPRKSANPVRKIIRDVQVSATPRTGRRTKDMIEQTPSHDHHQNPFLRLPPSGAPPSNDFCIPSSAAHPPSSMVPATVQRSATARSLAHSSIAETPSKAPNTKAYIFSGAARRTIFATPSKCAVSSTDSGLLVSSQVNETPSKSIENSPPTNSKFVFHLAATPTEADSSTLSNLAKTVGETSIYDALGWNDDDDDML
ncbi:DNA replication regulator SLD3-domain-containing protein [Pyrenochaeta sp. MPI-SDFR-AT-0127]|nr:DNA replication regulator SLD3-domain-containing protein [Pyrenochaeta sp. MPI-SDFR-AT-0127]